MNGYTCALLDPRTLPAAIAANEALFARGSVYGIEVTVPALAGRCVGNLDPQHTGQNAGMAAIEAALFCELPPEGTILATVRADLDAIGAMVILSRRMSGYPIETAMPLILQVARADKFANAGYPGPQALPSRTNRWPSNGGVDSTESLVAINAAIADFKVPIAERTVMMEKWLMTGEEPAQYRKAMEATRDAMITALENGQITVETRGNIAVVQSNHLAATNVGYAHAPVVVALNPEFRFQGGEPHRKFTVCQFNSKFVDLKTALGELAEMEPGWGGSPTIGGSPQGVSSTLTINHVVEVIERHLR